MSYYTFAQCARAAAFPALLLTSILSLAFVTVAAQDKKQTQSSADDDVIKINSNLVSLDVVVKDKKGKAITDLKPEDFTVSENGVPQRIEFFDSTLANADGVAQSADTNVFVQ